MACRSRSSRWSGRRRPSRRRRLPSARALARRPRTRPQVRCCCLLLLAAACLLLLACCYLLAATCLLLLATYPIAHLPPTYATLVAGGVVVSSITIGTDTTIGGTDTDTVTDTVTDTTGSVPQTILCSPVDSPVRSPIVMRSRPLPGLPAGAGIGLYPPRQLDLSGAVAERPAQPGTPAPPTQVRPLLLGTQGALARCLTLPYIALQRPFLLHPPFSILTPLPPTLPHPPTSTPSHFHTRSGSAWPRSSRGRCCCPSTRRSRWASPSRRLTASMIR